MTRKHRKTKAQRRKRHRTKEQLDTDHEIRQKTKDMHQAIQMNDLPWLRRLGRQTGGFLTDSFRMKIWPILLYCPEWSQQPKNNYAKHQDETQVALDVPRSLSTWPKGITEKHKKKLRQQLNHVIVQTLRRYPDLHYYQGFHDICTVFLLVYGNQDAASQLTGRVALFYLRDAMLESLEPILRELQLMNTLITLEDPELGGFLQETGVLPFYSLSWVITWFSHDLDDLNVIVRLFDFFLCSTPMMPLYLSAALVLLHRQPLLDQDPDPSIIHSYLCKLPRQQLPLDRAIDLAIALESRWDPRSLQSNAAIALDRSSVINTHHPTKSLSIDEATAILALDPALRIPLDLSSSTKKKLAVVSPWSLFMVGAVGIGAAALLVAHHPQLLSQSWPIGY